ncbi:MAG: helix-turn-helix domain-containing protein [Cyanobacteria bacterium P01_E01_bin.35]
MNYNIYKPNNCLSDFVKYYWQLALDSNLQTVHTNRVIPSNELQMIFHYKTPFREVDKCDHHLVQPQTSICGQQTEYKDIVSSDSVGMLAVVFYPYALRAFLPNQVSEFTNRSISLNDLFPAETNKLEERIIEADNIRSRILLIENFLLKRLSVPNSFSIAREAVNIVTKVNGQITVGEMANQLNVSKRQLERIFLANVGISPKKLGRIIRFNTSIKLFRQVEPLTTLAYEAGYFDQSHLVRDFKEFSGLSPKAFFRQPCQTQK